MASKDIQLNDLYKLPFPAQLGLAVGLVIAILALGYFLIFSDQYTSLGTTEQEEVTLRDDYSKKAQAAAQLPALKKQLEQINSSFSVLLKQLPTEAEVPNLIQELHDAASSNGMRLDKVMPQAVVNDGPIDILPYDISLTGSHAQLSRFARDVGKLSRIITLSNIKFVPTKPDSSDTFTLSAQANTYKAVDSNAQLAAPAAASDAAGQTQEAPQQ